MSFDNLICGQNSAMPARLVGCGKPIAGIDDLYRCTHCSTPFHRDCAEKHFKSDNIFTQEMFDSITPEEWAVIKRPKNTTPSAVSGEAGEGE